MPDPHLVPAEGDDAMTWCCICDPVCTARENDCGKHATVTRIPPETPEQVKARDRADIDRDFAPSVGADPIAFLGEPDE